MDLARKLVPGHRKLLLEGLVVLPVLLVPLYFLWEGSLIGDWTIFYRQASLRLLMGESPSMMRMSMIFVALVSVSVRDVSTSLRHRVFAFSERPPLSPPARVPAG